MSKKKKQTEQSAESRTEKSFETSKHNAAQESTRREIFIVLGLIAAVFLIYAQTFSHDFVYFDDDQYILNNRVIRNGLAPETIRWAFTSFYAGNWHPLTWISHALDYQLFGLDAGKYHLINTLFHAANTILAFFAFRRLSGKIWHSAVVALLFAIHPLHVESVAWIAERKDLLSTFFWLLTMYAYAIYAENVPDKKWFWLALLFFALGLLAKPMLVTLPFVLLLLDYFPLRRVVWEREEGLADLIKKSLPLALEKLPFFALTVVSSVVTFIAQKTGGAVQELEVISLGARFGNTIVAYASYLISMFFPYNLAVFYPYPSGGRPLWQIISALILILGISFAALWTAKTRPYLIFGWLWFLGTLVPVIGLVQVGRQSMADRYTYIPYFGLFVMLIWGAAEIIQKYKIPEKAVAVAVAVITAILGFLCWQQVGYWKNSDTLFSRTLAVTENNLAINYNYGIYLGKRNNPQKAVAHFAEAIRLDPNFYSAVFNMGVSLAAQGKFDEAMKYYNRALELRPDSAEVYLNAGSALAQQNKFDEAFLNLQKALELDPNAADAQTNVGLILLQRQRVPEAMRYLQRAVELNPDNAEYHNNLGLGWLVQGNRAEAVKSFGYALQINPGFAKAQANLKRAQEAGTPR